MTNIRTIEQGLLPTQCRKRLVEASRATPEGWCYAWQEDGGLYDWVDPSRVSDLQRMGFDVVRVWVEA